LLLGFAAFIALSAAFFYEINLLGKTKTKGRRLAFFVYFGLFLFGCISYLFRHEPVHFTSEVVAMAMFVGVLSYMSTTWKVDVVKKIPTESSGVIFGMISVFHVVIESVLRGYVLWNMVLAVVLMCISISMVYKINIKAALFEAIMYCIAISLLRNFEFAMVQHYHAEPFSWMAVMSIPAFFMFLIQGKSSDMNMRMDSEAKKLAVLWLVLPPLYHYMIIMISPTIAAITVTTGYVFASIAKSKHERGWAAGTLALCSVALVSV